MIVELVGQSIGELSSDHQPITALENGALLLLPQLKFALSVDEKKLLGYPWVEGKSKNISFDSKHQRLHAGEVNDEIQRVLQAVLKRYVVFAQDCVTQLFPHYSTSLLTGRTSFRPFEAAGRSSPSYRKDDTRLHVDAFPATPNQGLRLLRVFHNINPYHHPRVWKVGEPFEQLVEGFAPRLNKPWKMKKHILKTLQLTKSLRTDYDDLMLQLHDKMKADEGYQKNVRQQLVNIPAGATWIVFSDSVSHAVVSGQYCLEQTFMLPVAAMQDPQRSPLRILERKFGCSLTSVSHD